MRRLATIALLLVLGACRPGDTAAWVRFYEQHPRRALHHLRVEHPALWARSHPERWEPDTACSQWAQTALDVGWSREQWLDPIARIMYAESRCNPDAYNPASGVAGLMQIHPLWWNAGAGGVCVGDRYDPATNLRCARYVYSVQGWRAWVTY